ncbi:hypothetical protein P692DRAFT_20874583 [Suillus brevipes Sb2]|nr:hypothetical protein P692DRAFT_20874583 [Suillus brevipes Sb2]
MSASTPQKSTTLDDYDFAFNFPPLQGSQHNRGISFGSSPPMRSKECAFQVYDLRLSPFTFHITSLVHRQGPNDYSSPASSQHAVTTPVMRAVNPNAWTPDNLGTAAAYNLSQSVPYRQELRDARSWAGMNNAPHSTLPMPDPIGHASLMSWHHGSGMTTSDTHSFAHMMANPDAWTPDNLGTAAAHNLSQSVPYRHDLRDAWSWAGMDNAPHDTLPMPDPIGHTLPMSRHHGSGMNTSDMHSFAHMMANPEPVPFDLVRSELDRHNPGDARSRAGMVAPHGTSLTPGSIGHASLTSRHHGIATSDMHSFAPVMAKPYPRDLHDPGVMNRQSELPITQPPSRVKLEACNIGKTAIFLYARWGRSNANGRNAGIEGEQTTQFAS